MTKAFDSAVRLLARREHGAIELCEKLKKNGYSPTEINEALDRCQELGLQSDARFVESYTRSRIRQGYGPVKIRQELKSKGIDGDLIHSELDKERDNWQSYALDVWQKKTRGRGDWSYNELQKHQKFLLYRGFSMDTIIMIMKE